MDHMDLEMVHKKTRKKNFLRRVLVDLYRNETHIEGGEESKGPTHERKMHY